MKKVSCLLFIIWTFSFQAQESKDFKVGLVLSGGGAKGYAHIGVLKALEESGLRIDYIGGTSMGAIVGGLYASGYSADQLSEIMYDADFEKILWEEKSRKEKTLFDKTYREKYILQIPFKDFEIKIPSAISKGQGSYNYLKYQLRHINDSIDFNTLPIPFLCVATNLETGKQRTFTSGDLASSIMASAALPGLIEPVAIGDSIYIDGGMENNLPAEELKNNGLDYIIGVDLGQNLKTKEEINDISSLLSQLINITILKGVDEQRSFLDLEIHPKLEKYTVLSFEEKDSIYQKGYLEGKKYAYLIDSLVSLQQEKPLKKSVHTTDSVSISSIKTHSLTRYNSPYILGKMKIKPPKIVDYKDINKGISRLYSTDNFEKIQYALSHDSLGKSTLHIYLTETKNNVYAKFGLHYDELLKTGLLVNLTFNHFLFDNTFMSFDMIFGDYPRYSFHFFTDNGVLPSIGVNSEYTNVPIDILSNNSGTNKYQVHNFMNEIYSQSTLFDKYSAGLGLRWNYINVKKDNLSNSTIPLHLENSYYLSPHFFLRVDNRDNAFFPKNGGWFLGGIQYYMLSNQESFRPFFAINASSTWAIELPFKFTLQPEVSFGSSIDNKSTFLKYFFGGDFEQNILYFQKFFGFDELSLSGEHYMMFRGQLQYELFTNNYITLFGNILNVENELEQLRFLDYTYVGYGLSYGYDSPLGPIKLRYAYSPNTKDYIFSVSLGYSF